MLIKSNNTDDLYGRSIISFLAQELPGSNRNSPSDMLEAVYNEVVGTKQVRRGPTPDPERAVALREVIRAALSSRVGVPILIPWGGFKASRNADVADVMGLRMIKSLDERVRQYHPPGIWPIIRLEAYTERTLYSNRNRDAAQQYMDDFRKLTQLILPGTAIVSEDGQGVDAEEFRQRSEHNAVFLHTALDLPAGERGRYLAEHLPVWSGEITDEMIEYYTRVNRTLSVSETGGESDAEVRGRVARYFGRSLARYQYGVTGGDQFGTWKNLFITLSFVQSPFGRMGRRIYYRTLPERYGHTHFAPWIGRGYLKINGNTVTPALRSSTENEPWLTPNLVTISDEAGCEVTINGDYYVEA